MKTKIANFPTPSILNQDDDFTCGATPDESFTTKSAYLTQLSGNSSSTEPIFKIIWKWKGNVRVQTFLWKLGHEALLTNVERQRRTMDDSGTCPICRVEEETLLHRFRDCNASLAIWSNFKFRKQSQFFSNVNWKKWLETNLKHKEERYEELHWNILFGDHLGHHLERSK